MPLPLVFSLMVSTNSVLMLILPNEHPELAGPVKWSRSLITNEPACVLKVSCTSFSTKKKFNPVEIACAVHVAKV